MSTKMMPKPNEALRDFFKDNDVYAAVFNDFLFKENIIDPADLVPEDASYTETILTNSKSRKINKYRDNVRRTKNRHFLIVGIEDQDKIHYAMPIRNMLYDVLSYTHELSLCETEKGVKKQWSVDERLSNVSKGTKIASVITVVFYTGENAWDGPRSLHDMLLIDEEIDEFIPDYPLHIIDLGHDPNLSFANEDLEQLRVALSSIYSETAETCNYEIKDSILALTGILSNDQQLYEYVNEKKGGVRPMCEALRKRDERIKADVAEEWSKVVAERDSKLAEKDSKLAEKDRKLAEKEAEIMALKEQLRLAQA